MREDFYRLVSTSGYGNATSVADANTLRTQVEVIRDVMLSASACDTWLTLHEISQLTRFGEASISAQLRHLRKPTFGGFHVQKRRRFGAGEIMVLRERRRPPIDAVGDGQSATSSLAAHPKRRRSPANWRRAFGLKPGSWEYCVAR